jgi:hypothetical protein
MLAAIELRLDLIARPAAVVALRVARLHDEAGTTR